MATAKHMRASSVASRGGLLVLSSVAVVAAAAAVYLLHSGGIVAMATGERPIISQMMWQPTAYDGKRVTIYGLVVEASQDGSRFSIQDVAQMPLSVEGPPGTVTRVGDQLLVQGIFRAGSSQPVLKAEKLTATKVLGGGGCC